MKSLKNKKWPLFFVGMLWGVLLTFIPLILYMRSNIIKEHTSKLNFDETVKRVQLNVKRTNSWIVKKVSCSLPQTNDKTRMVILKLCHRKYASIMLNDESSRKIAAAIPCTFAIYEKKDGKTYISQINVSMLGYILGGNLAEIFPQKVATEQDFMLKGIIE